MVALYDERQRARLGVKPGVTGPMQVYGRSDLTFEERLAMERDYLDNLSLLTDLAILLRTPRAVIRRGVDPAEGPDDPLDRWLLRDTWAGVLAAPDPYHNPGFAPAPGGYGR